MRFGNVNFFFRARSAGEGIHIFCENGAYNFESKLFNVSVNKIYYNTPPEKTN
jgi:hypothetical protein